MMRSLFFFGLLLPLVSRAHEAPDPATIAEGQRLVLRQYMVARDISVLQTAQHEKWLQRLGPNADIFRYWKGPSAAHSVVDTSYFDGPGARPVLFVGRPGSGKTWNLDAMTAFVIRHARPFDHVSLRMSAADTPGLNDYLIHASSMGRSDSHVLTAEGSRAQRQHNIFTSTLGILSSVSPGGFVFVDFTTEDISLDEANLAGRGTLDFLDQLRARADEGHWHLVVAVSTLEFENMRQRIQSEECDRLLEDYRVLSLDPPKLVLSEDLKALFPGKTQREVLMLLYPELPATPD